MANIKLKDVLSLYSTPARTENPAIESSTTLKRICVLTCFAASFDRAPSK